MKMRSPDHQGMMVDYQGMLRQAREALRGGLHAEMLRQLQEHLKEMGERFYAGDPSAVDEFLQLYCIARDHRNQPVPQSPEAEALRLFVSAAYPVSTEINPRGYNWSEAYLDQALANAKELAVGS